MWVKKAATNARNSKNIRMAVIGWLMLILVILFFTWGKAKAVLIVLFILLAIALGLEGFDYDADLAKLWETKSYSEARVETVKDADGNTIRLITGVCNSKEFDLNCSSFSTQGEAQAKYQECVDTLSKDNPDVDVAKLDVYRLDGDKDGIVCEALPKTAQ